MSDEQESLSPRARALFDAERTRPDDPQDRVARVYDRLATSIVLGATGEVSRSAEATSSDVTRSDVLSGGTARGAAITSALSGKTVALVLGVFLVGGGAGAALQARLDSRSVVAAPTPPAVLSPSVSTSVSTPAQAEKTLTPNDLPSIPASSAATSERATAPRARQIPETLGERDVDLSHERESLERARMAGARRDFVGVLTALDEHQREYPNGRLAEEREALAVGALIELGRVGEARERGARFQRQHPTSVFVAAIEAALAREKENDGGP